ncbi:MAG: hexapeptide transferase [Clostridia bacterium]|nr:hexapeptide transferase [Clostridia bacterium]
MLKFKIMEKLTSRLDSIYVNVSMQRMTEKKAEYAKKRIKMIDGGYNGSRSEFNSVVRAYWKKYGIKPDKFWYDIYCNGKEAYDPRYITDAVYYRNIVPYFNKMMMRRAYTDKSMYSRLISDIKLPKTVVKNIGGYYFDGDGDNPISFEDAVKLCENEEHLIIKPSVYSGCGKGITFYDKNREGQQSIDSMFKEFKRGFVAQRLVEQHPDLAAVNSSSLNTIRVVTFKFKGETHVLSTLLRMGGVGSRVDNISAGGISCVIKPDGWLADRSVTRKSEWSDEHPGGVKFRDIHVPNFDKVIETAKRTHAQLPYFDLIGWDFAVDKDGDPVMIEFNVMPESNQISCGPTFGDLTDEVLDEVFLKKSNL